MPQVSLTVRHAHDLHARPAAQFVQAAGRFRSDIRVIYGGREGNAKSILSVLALGIDRGSRITLSAQGEDADEALATLADLLENGCGQVG